MTTLILTGVLREQIAREARVAFPRECCGLIEGNALRIATLHPARNISKDDDRFEIDPADHFRSLRAARANGRNIIGCYHSHPNGRAEPSVRDGDGEDGFLWVIAAVSGEAVRLTAFQRIGEGWRELAVAPQPMENAA